MALFARKLIAELNDEAVPLDTGLKRILGPWQLTALGVGAIIGAGIFSGAGTAIAGGADHLGAGPALMLSYVLVAIACGFAALCYAEFAAMIPQAGSAYTYAYATLGEMVAWIIGWDLIIEYAVGNVAVAVSWSGYFQALLRPMGLAFPEWLAFDPMTAKRSAAAVADAVSRGVDPATLSDYVQTAALAFNQAPVIAGLHIVFNLPAV